jgi:galactose oxidase
MLGSGVASALLAVGIVCSTTNAMQLPYKPPPKAVLDAEGILPPKGFTTLAAPANSGALNPAGWTVNVDSYQPGNDPQYAIDGNTNSFWHTQWTPNLAQLPHTITIDMKQIYNIDGITYLPRQDGQSNGNIGTHKVYTSTDGNNFGNPVAYGTWHDDQTLKSAPFETRPARYVRLVAFSEAGNRGPWSSAAEIQVYQAPNYTPPPTNLGSWGPTINFPLVPVAAAVEPNSGKILTWSSYSADTFTNGPGGQTLTSVYDPASQTVSQRLVTNTGHDMFCPGISMDANGRVIVTGGNDSPKTSIFDPGSDSWIPGSNMNIPRGYQTSATASDGRIFTIGGSWSGGLGGKNGEIYNPKTNTWSLLPSCPVAPMLTNDAQGVYRQDNHGWLFGWKNGFVFQAGPSKAMNWYLTSGNGAQVPAGNRANDDHSMCGNAVMYDALNGKIITLGGSPDYQGTTASAKAHIITVPNPINAAQVTQINPMWFNRIFANAVVMPNGKVFIVGGQTVGNPFSDDGAQYTPEIWEPGNTNFYKMLPNTIPRTYHSWALLLPDATIMVGGGGLCGTCSTNHMDAQVFSPPYLLNGDGTKAGRPVINSVSGNNFAPGNTVTFTTNYGVATASLIRYGTATHTVNSDQRRIPLTLNNAGTNTYSFTLPNDYGILLPGYWMLFAIDGNDRPSVAKTIQIRGP